MIRAKKEDKVRTEVDELIEPLRIAMTDYMWKNRKTLQDVADEAKVSCPLVADIKNGHVGNVTLNRVLLIAASIGIKLEFKISKRK